MTLRVGRGWHLDTDEQALGAPAGSLAFTGEVVRRDARKHSLAWEIAGSWMRTGLGQLATYGEKVSDESRKSAEALLEAVGASAENAEIHGSDEAFFLQLDLDRSDMRDVARCGIKPRLRRRRKPCSSYRP
ncbi:unnamed protein product [marine sediment metagenome]|uniref:Uncharacterized protein n=1 Tax=marine sediment metagenome TaxID=412755 RepID=X1TAN7_9ZZZZ